MVDISVEPIKDFLDACDIVLNSNTFILKFENTEQSLKESLVNFLQSRSFLIQIKNQDIEREWFNLHYFDTGTESFQLKPGQLVKKSIVLQLSDKILDKKEYLIRMLTTENNLLNYKSFYETQKSRPEAEEIVNRFVITLLGDQDWQLFLVKPDFLQESGDSYESETICYFENDFGNDSATIISGERNAYLLLTNGIP